MYTVTKQELIYILDTANEMIDTDEVCHEELREIVTFVDAILENEQVEID